MFAQDAELAELAESTKRKAWSPEAPFPAHAEVFEPVDVLEVGCSCVSMRCACLSMEFLTGTSVYVFAHVVACSPRSIRASRDTEAC